MKSIPPHPVPAVGSRIYDCFSFSNELDVLEIRLHELYSVVDKFVIIESNITHSGSQKILHFEANRERFRRFADKIIHVPLMSSDTLPLRAPHESAWQRERAQRDHAHPFLLSLGARSFDIMIVSDVDEIPRASTVAGYRVEMGLRKLDMPLFYYYLDLCTASSGWASSFILPVGDVHSNLSDIRGTDGPRILRAGWHFSYMGGVNIIMEKLRSYAHTEFNQPDICNESHVQHCLSKHVDLFGRPGEFRLVQTHELPDYVFDNQLKLRHLLSPG